MDGQLDGQMEAGEYDAVVSALASDAADRADADDPVWAAVGEVVPQLTEPVCRRVLEHAAHEPQADVVAEVTEVRESGDAERLRARALTALVADVRERADAAPSTDPGDDAAP